MHLRIFLISLLAFSSVGNASYFGNRPGKFEIDLTSSYFKSTKNYDDSSKLQSLAAGHDFTQILNAFSMSYDYDEDWTFYGSFDLSYAASTDTNFTRKDTRPTDVTGGVSYYLYSGAFNIIPSLTFLIPLRTFDNGTDEVIMNDGVYEVIPEVHITKRWHRVLGELRTGLNARMGGRSWLAPFGVELQYHFRKVAIGGGVEGSFSVKDDDDTKNPTKHTDVTTRVNAGSLAYYGINSNIVKAQAWLRYYIEPQFYLSIGAKQSLMGKNSADGTELVARACFTFGGERASASNLPNLRTKKYKPNGKEFQYQFQKDLDEDADVFGEDAETKQYKNNIEYQDVDDKLDNVESSFEVKVKAAPTKKTIKKKRKKSSNN